MGMWGFELYQNDTALDVKGDFEELYNAGKTVREITDQLTSDYADIMSDVDEESLFWFALADTQWNFGVLLPDVKEKALCLIHQNLGMFLHRTADEHAKAQRKKTLDDLKDKLLSPQPPTKKAVKRRVYKCRWKLGDVFAYRLESDLSKQKGLYGRYFLIQKVDEGTWYPGHIVPIVYVKMTGDSHLPSNEEEFNRAEYVQTCFTKYERRFFPIDMRRPQEDIAEKSKLTYTVDEYGYLPQYRIQLNQLSERDIPSKLIYIGNFTNTARPQNEFVPHTKLNLSIVSWKHFDETFETRMITLYCGHNRREFRAYNRDRISKP